MTGQDTAGAGQAAAVASHGARLASFWSRHGRDGTLLPPDDEWWAELSQSQREDEIAGARAAAGAFEEAARRALEDIIRELDELIEPSVGADLIRVIAERGLGIASQLLPAPDGRRSDTGTITHTPTGATWVTWDEDRQPPWELIAEAAARLTGGAVKVRAVGGDPGRLAVAVYRELPEPEDE